MLSSCTYNSVFKKPSFKKYSNEVSYEEFFTSFKDKYQINSLLGENGDIKKSLVYSGYSYGDANRVIKNKNNKTMYDVSSTVTNQITAQYDSNKGIGNSDVETHRSETEQSFKTSTVKSNKESKIKTQYVKGENDKGVIGIYQRSKIYINLDDEMSVTKYLVSSIRSSFTFGESFIPNYDALSEDIKTKYHFYLDGDVYTITFSEQAKYTYSAWDYESEGETIFATSTVENEEKRQYVLSDKPSYASIRTTKETMQYSRDFMDRMNGDVETYKFSNYIKSQVSFKYVNIKAISYKNFDHVTQLPAID